MNEIRLLAGVQWRRSLNRLRAGGAGAAVKLAFGVLLGACFLGALHLLALRALRYFLAVPVVGPAMVERLLSLVLLTFFGLVLYSNLLSSASSAYLSRDLEFLLSLPVRRWKVVLGKALESLLDASWMAFLLFLPLLLAYAEVYRADFWGTLAAFTCLGAFLLIPGALGFLGIALLMRLFPARKVRDFFLFAGVAALAAGLTAVRLARPETIVRDPEAMETWMEYLEGLRAPVAPYLPSAWASRALLGALAGKEDLLRRGALLLFGVGIPLSTAAFLAAQRLFYRGWCHAQESQNAPPAPGRKTGGTILERLLSPLPGPLAALAAKDLSVFARDSTQWGQLLLLASLVGVYVSNFRRLPLADYPDLRPVIFFLSIGFTGLILAAVAARFAFPAVSLEGRAFWILRSAPIPPRTVLWGKFLLAFLPLAGLSVLVTLLSLGPFGADAFLTGLAATDFLLFAAGLSALGVGLGAMLPVLDADNAAKISTSLGGYFFMMLAVTLILATLFWQAAPVRLLYTRGAGFLIEHPWEVLVPAVQLATVYVLAFLVPFTAGAARIRGLEP